MPSRYKHLPDRGEPPSYHKEMNKYAEYICLPTEVGHHRYVWPGMRLGVSACDEGAGTNMGVFATQLLKCGTRFPVLGFDRTLYKRSRSDYSFQMDNNGPCLDGDPRLDPVQGVGTHGLAIAMKINEPPASSAFGPNVICKGGWMVCVRDIQTGQELFTHYAATYPRDTHHRDATTGYVSTVAYTIHARTANYQISETAHTTIQRRRPSDQVLRQLLATQYARVPAEPRGALGRWCVPGRRTGIGYDFHVQDPTPKLVLRVTDWITAEMEPEITRRRGLFVGPGYTLSSGEAITTYSGYIVDQRALPAGHCTRYLATVLRGTFAIDGFRFPVSEHGMAQFANDVHGSPRRSANAELRMGPDFERVLVATESIGPGQEILVSITDHRRTHLGDVQSFVVNRLRTCANNELCVIRYTYDDGTIEPVVCHLSNIQSQDCCVRWYAAVMEGYTSVSEMLASPFLPGWERVRASRQTQDTDICFAELPPEPRQEWVPYVTHAFVLRTPDILVHAVERCPATHSLQPDLVQYLRRRLRP